MHPHVHCAESREQLFTCRTYLTLNVKDYIGRLGCAVGSGGVSET